MKINLCFGCMNAAHANPCPHCGYDVRSKAKNYALRPGTILHGKYLVGKVLGQGGFGITYIGFDLVLQRKVAIKEYFPSAHVTRTHGSTELQWYATAQARDARNKGKEMILKEARKMSRVSSVPLVVQVLDLFEDNETAYIIMDYIQGETLMSAIRNRGPMSWETVRDLLLPVAETLGKVHEAGLIHRDLSPDNLMIRPDGSIAILDLGAAKDLKFSSGASSMQVAKGGFSPLEQYMERGGSGTWTDVYGLSATMYYALTGVTPPSAVERMDKDPLRWDLPQLKALPGEVLNVLKQGMALQGKNRIQTMEELLQRFRDALRKKPVKGKRIALAAAIAALVLLFVLFKPHPDPYATGELPQPPEATQETTEDPETQPEPETEFPVEAPVWIDNVLMASNPPQEYLFNTDEAPVFGSRITRRQIVTVTFLDSLEAVGDNSWDVSQKRDGSVLAWTDANGTVQEWELDGYLTLETFDLYIAAEGGINGKYCSRLFEGFKNMTSLDFGGCFHTDYAESMEYMFSGCYSLEQLDVGQLKTGRVKNMAFMFNNLEVKTLDVTGFDTSNVENMSAMFSYCDALESLDVTGFDTGKVTDMGDMFSMCAALRSLDLSSFDTSRVTDMSFMFTYIDLKELDISHFDTSMVNNMAYMFSGSDKLISLDLRNFNTSQVTNMQGMFQDCTSLREILGVADWDTSNVKYYENFLNEGITVDGKPWEDLFR